MNRAVVGAAGMMLGLLLTTIVLAQGAGQLAVGDRVRVQLSGAPTAKLVGNLTAVSQDRLVISTPADPAGISLLRSNIRKIQRSKGQKSRAVLGFTLGLLGGAAIGVVYGAAGHPGLPHRGGDVPQELEYLLPFSLGGMILGALLGSASKTERWQTAPPK